jgi:HEAT repeat protein
MSVIDKLATSLNRRDEVPNQELAAQIIAGNDKEAVNELVDLLQHKSRDIQGDAIKTLYEIGTQKPLLIASYATNFIALLDNKNNRLQWGAMTALNTITTAKPEDIYTALPRLAAITEAGSVITRDNYVGILIKLVSLKKYENDAFPLLNEQLLGCPPNQLPMYAEQALPFIPEAYKAAFAETLSSRLGDFEKESKRKRVEQVLKKSARK